MKRIKTQVSIAVKTEGGLLPADFLQRLMDGKDVEGVSPESYHLAPNEKINEAINRSWNRTIVFWKAYKTAQEKLGSEDTGTSITREKWLLPLFNEFGFGRLQTSKAIEIEGKSYAISHFWQNVPIHLVGFNVNIDKRTPGVDRTPSLVQVVS